MKHIVWGICGIGNGHIGRQLPLMETMLTTGKYHINVLLSEGRKLPFEHPNVKVHNVEVPRVHFPTKQQITYNTDHLPETWEVINREVLNKLSHNTTHLVVSDYEPISAMHAYRTRTPLVTLDQQSKFLNSELTPTPLGAEEEKDRLKFFFPTAHTRIAATFFKTTQKGPTRIVGPIINNAAQYTAPKFRKHHLIYLTTSNAGSIPLQTINDVIQIVERFPSEHFVVSTNTNPTVPVPPNVTHIQHYHPQFYTYLNQAKSVICTAGHGLLSHTTHLRIPTLAIPNGLHEQNLNAEMITKAQAGVSCSTLTPHDLKLFLNNISYYTNNLHNQPKNLILEPSNAEVITHLETVMSSPP